VGEKRTTAALLGGMTVALLVGKARCDRAAVLVGREGGTKAAAGRYYRCASEWKRWTKVALLAGRGLSC
jgi:hypothetical protein